jgi:spoIIIJ-associated protein
VIDAPGPAWSTVQEPAPWQPVRREESEARGGDDEELDRILDLVEEFLDSWGMDLEMDVRTSDERLEIDFFGEDQQYLLEKKGEGLLSLQLILGKMLYKRGLIRRKLQVDCQGYRQGREKELREIANRTADRVKKNGEDALLNPMNPYERRIIHLTLADDQQVTTDSLGDGYMKKIRIFRT